MGFRFDAEPRYSGAPSEQIWDRDPLDIKATVAAVESYGLAFVGFGQEVTGCLRLVEMRFY